VQSRGLGQAIHHGDLDRLVRQRPFAARRRSVNVPPDTTPAARVLSLGEILSARSAAATAMPDTTGPPTNHTLATHASHTFFCNIILTSGKFVAASRRG
jgi:hypothetical protein